MILRNVCYYSRISTHTPARGVTPACPDSAPCCLHFYSHAREGRDEVMKTIYDMKTDFYSHAREGRDMPGMVSGIWSGNFYSHAREGRDVQNISSSPPDDNVYSHAREGRDPVGAGAVFILCYFYSHAREGRDILSDLLALDTRIISTHTPARGVTHKTLSKSQYCIISTHTPARGVTSRSLYLENYIIHFYSHAREGRDRQRKGSGTDYLSFLLTRPRGA